MSSELTGLSYVVMNMIGRNGAGPHDLVQMARREQRLYWAGAESKIYEQPKRLEKLGYLTSQKTPGKTHERTHYQLTDKGVRAVQEWLALRSPFPRIQNEAAISPPTKRTASVVRVSSECASMPRSARRPFGARSDQLRTISCRRCPSGSRK